MADTALITSNVDPEISAAMAIYGRLAPLQDALNLGDLTEAEMHLFAMVAYHTGLDPFTKQIYAVKRKGKVVHQTGIDGYRSVAENKGGGQYAGSSEAEFEDCDCGQEPKGHPKVARVVVHRLLQNGHMVNQTGIARWHELYTAPARGNGQSEDETTAGFMWRKMPYNQLAKCAEANGLRKAFPRVLGGVYIAEEMQQADTIEGTATRVVAPTAAERIAARRAQVEAKPTETVEGEVVSETPVATAPDPTAVETCGDEDASPMMGGYCELPKGHAGVHRRDQLVMAEVDAPGLFDGDEPQGWLVPTGYTAELRDPPARCRSCNAEIAWAQTPAGRRMPLNRDGTSHFANCPQANDWRKRK